MLGLLQIWNILILFCLENNYWWILNYLCISEAVIDKKLKQQKVNWITTGSGSDKEAKQHIRDEN